MKKVAVVIDGGFVRKTFQKNFRGTPFPTADQIIKLSQDILNSKEELFRIYYYDCLPYEKPIKKLISQDIYKNESLINAGKRYISELSMKNNLAYRKGELKFNGWSLKNYKLKEILLTKRQLNDDDFKPILKQKRIDMKMGLDIAWLSIRKIVEKIILIAGDSDFIPAMKLSRIEGIQVVVAPLRNRINRDMQEHSDEIRDYDIKKLRGI